MTQKLKGGKSLFKKIILISAVLFVVGAVIFAAVLAMLPWEQYRKDAVAALSQTLGREVSIGAIDASIFTGVTIKDISIANKNGFSQQALFSNQQASLRTGILTFFSALMTGRLVVDAVVFESPAILFEVDKNGNNNLAGIGSSPSGAVKTKQNAAAPKTESKEDSKKSANLPLTVASIEIRNASLTYRDQSKKQGDTLVKNLNLSLRGFTLSGVGSSSLEVGLEVETEGKVIPIGALVFFNLDLDKDQVELKSFKASVPGITVEGSGMITALTKDLNLTLKSAVAISIEKVVKDLLPPSALKSMPPGLKTGGTVSVKLNAAYKASDPLATRFNGEVLLAGVSAVYGDYPALKELSGTLTFDRNALKRSVLDMKIADQAVRVALKADYDLVSLMGPTSGMKANIQYEISSPKLILDPILALTGNAAVSETGGQGTGTTASEAIADYRKTIPMGISVAGVTKVNAFQIKEILTGSMEHRFELKKQKVVSQLGMNLFDGTLQNTLKADLSKLGVEYEFAAIVKGMRISPFADAVVASYPTSKKRYKLIQQLKGKVSGALSFDAKGSGSDLRTAQMIQNLKMSGLFSVANLRVQQLEMQSKLAAAIPNSQASAALARDTNFEYVGGGFAMKSGRFDWTKVKGGSGKNLREGELYLESDGWFLPPAGQIDARMETHFNPSVVPLQGTAKDLLGDDKGWATFDLYYRGKDLDSADADYKAGAKKAVEKAVQKQVEKAKEQLTQEGQKVIQEKGKELIKQLPGGLKGLFGQ